MPDTVKVVVTVAMQSVLEQLAADFLQATGYGIEMAFGPPSRATRMVLDGESADIVMTTPEDIEALVKAGKVVPGSGRPVLSMIMGVAVRAGAPKPDISTPEKFKQALLAAKSVTHANAATGSPSAAHFLKVVERLGIADAVARKATRRSGVVAHAVASGECAMAVQQLAELMLVDGIHVLGPFPHELQNYVPLAAGIHAQSAAKADAKALIDMLLAPKAKVIIEQAGLLTA
jgi:molybdate transport system substrate-binding protein